MSATARIKKGDKVRINCHVEGYQLVEEFPYAKGVGEVVDVLASGVSVVFAGHSQTYLFNPLNIILQPEA